MSQTLFAERDVSKSKQPEPSPFVTVKVKRSRHTKLSLIASAQGRDIASVLDDLIAAPLEKIYRQEQAKLDQANGG